MRWRTRGVVRGPGNQAARTGPISVGAQNTRFQRRGSIVMVQANNPPSYGLYYHRPPAKSKNGIHCRCALQPHLLRTALCRSGLQDCHLQGRRWPLPRPRKLHRMLLVCSGHRSVPSRRCSQSTRREGRGTGRDARGSGRNAMCGRGCCTAGRRCAEDVGFCLFLIEWLVH